MQESIAIYKKSSDDKLSKIFVYFSIIDAFQVFCLLDHIFPDTYTLGIDTDNPNPFYYEVEYVDSFLLNEYRPKRKRLKNAEDFRFALN